MSDDHLLAELSGHVSQVLLAAKAARGEIIAQARARAAALEQKSRQQTEREAIEYLYRARRKGQELVDEARQLSGKMLADAIAERDAMLGDLVTRRKMLEEEVQSRQAELNGLRQDCAAISGMAAEILNGYRGSASGSAPPHDEKVRVTQRRSLMSSVNSTGGLRRSS